MGHGLERRWRERFVGLAALLYGDVKDTRAYIETGAVRGSSGGAANLHTPEVARYMKAIEIAGRFIMPDEVDGVLAQHGTPTTETGQ